MRLLEIEVRDNFPDGVHHKGPFRGPRMGNDQARGMVAVAFDVDDVEIQRAWFIQNCLPDPPGLPFHGLEVQQQLFCRLVEIGNWREPVDCDDGIEEVRRSRRAVNRRTFQKR